MHPARPDVLFMQKHWDVMRSDDGGASWREISGDLPTDFGFVIDVHAQRARHGLRRADQERSEHYPPDARLRVYRSRTGGDEWEPLTDGLPQSDCYVNVLRDAMAVDGLAPAGSTSGHHRRAGSTLGRRWRPLVGDRAGPTGGAVGRGPGPPMIRVVLPAHLRTLAGVDGEVQLEVDGSATVGRPRALEARYRPWAGRSATRPRSRRRPFVRFFADEEDLSHAAPTTCSGAGGGGEEPFCVVGAMAGG